MNIRRGEVGITINQGNFTSNILQQFGMEEYNNFETPMAISQKLKEYQDSQLADPILYQEILGSIEKIREVSALRIQKVVRGFLCRLRIKRKMDNEFMERLQINDYSDVMPSDIQYLIARMHFSSRGGLSRAYLEIVTRKALTISDKLLKLATLNPSWLWRLQTMLKLVLRVIHGIPSEGPLDEGTALMCDALDTFTGSNTHATPITTKKIILYLLQNNYMVVMRNFLLRFHSHRDKSSDHAPNDPLEIDFAVKMIARPLTFINDSDDNYRDAVMDYLCRMIASENILSAPMKDLVIPIIASIPNFPLQAAVNIFLTYTDDARVPAALYFFLVLDKDQRGIPMEFQSTYFNLLALLSHNLTELVPARAPSRNEPIDLDTYEITNHNTLKELMTDCLQLLNSPARSQFWMNILHDAITRRDVNTILYHSICVFHLLLCDVTTSYRFRIIRDLWTAECWLRALWIVLESQTRQQALPHTEITIFALLKEAAVLTRSEAAAILPPLGVFSYFLFGSLSFVTDEDLLKPELIERNAVKPFTVNELIYIACTLKDVAVGLIALGYPEPVSKDWMYLHIPSADPKYNCLVWSQTLTECVKVVREVHQRNLRCHIIRENDWISPLLPVPENCLRRFVDLHNNIRMILPFNPLTPATMTDPFGNSIGAWYDKTWYLLTYLPFTIQVINRYKMWWEVLVKEKFEHQNPHRHYLQTSFIHISVRRDYLYEDAFDMLSIDNAPELKLFLRVQFLNKFSMEEAGIDGGGIFKEFMTELLTTAFDPNRGFFILTKDNRLYPNPNAASVYANFTTHYFFIGRMLGKAILEDLTVNIPLADFFLAKIIDSALLYPSYLNSLDNDMFKNISYLRTFNGDYSTLGLDFTTTSSSFGSNTVIELKPRGADIAVTEENVVEYVHLMAKQKLHSDISKQTRAFTKGLGNVLPLYMLRMFSSAEIQHIISGSSAPIDQSDLEGNATYSLGVTASHPNIIMFWRVFASLSDEEKGLLLKFVTSCSRPPLRGFRDLSPPFCIQLVENVGNRLPTASTCMNILKLPLYPDEKTMREKLVYAIQSGSGFELS